MFGRHCMRFCKQIYSVRCVYYLQTRIVNNTDYYTYYSGRALDKYKQIGGEREKQARKEAHSETKSKQRVLIGLISDQLNNGAAWSAKIAQILVFLLEQN